MPKSRLTAKSPLEFARQLSAASRGRAVRGGVKPLLARKDAAAPNILSSGQATIASVSLGQEVVFSQVADTGWEIGLVSGVGNGNLHINILLPRGYLQGLRQGACDGCIPQYEAEGDSLHQGKALIPPARHAMRRGADYSSHFDRLLAIFDEIGREYDRVAEAYDRFSCGGCTDNCCTTVFSHYTVNEHLWVLEGFTRLPQEEQRDVRDRATRYVDELRAHGAEITTLSLMCPVNRDGLCGIYRHRPLICRIHGVPAVLHTPGRGTQEWKGCLRF